MDAMRCGELQYFEVHYPHAKMRFKHFHRLSCGRKQGPEISSVEIADTDVAGLP